MPSGLVLTVKAEISKLLSAKACGVKKSKRPVAIVSKVLIAKVFFKDPNLAKIFLVLAKYSCFSIACFMIISFRLLMFS